MTVTELASHIRGALNIHLPAKVRVVGEISNLSDRTHWFFSLKDDAATIRCVCFASNAKRVRFAVKDGMAVIATGRVDFYDAQGHVQLYVDKLEPVGVGELELRFRALCDELRKLGYFEVERKKPLPAMAQRIAVVTSRSAAALQDVANTAHRRWPGCQLLLYDVRVQGEEAAPQIAAAIKRLSKQGAALGVEAIILTRGGGSIEDLWAFNERTVADAIYHCPLPIVAAIGHETDTTIAELVADERCATPTQAAMRLVPDARALLHQVEALSRRLATGVRREILHQRQRLEAAARHPIFCRPDRLYAPLRERLARLTERAHAAATYRVEEAKQEIAVLGARLAADMPHRLAAAQQRIGVDAIRLTPAAARLLKSRAEQLDALTRQLESVAPQRVLGRGYSVTLDKKGKAIRDASDVGIGEHLTTIVAKGRIGSTVDATDGGAPARRRETSGGTKQAAAKAPPQGKRKRSADDGPTLF